MSLSLLLAIACGTGAIWLSNKSYPDDRKKRVGWLTAAILFFGAMPILLYLSGATQ